MESTALATVARNFPDEARFVFQINYTRYFSEIALTLVT